MEGIVHSLNRRAFLASSAGLFTPSHPETLKPIVISVNAMFDQGAHSGKGLGTAERSQFWAYQEGARRDFATSGILFDVHVTEGAFVRQQGYSDIPDKFLLRRAINLFITADLGYDIDRDRTGGSSIGPRMARKGFAGDPYYKTFLGLGATRDTTLEHEYAHHFTLDTSRKPTSTGNIWADLRNDYWLWRQRHGVPIVEFRACAGSEWARRETTSG